MEKINWEAPKVGKDYPTEMLQVTARRYDTILSELSIPEKELVGKTIISVGNGLSELIPAANTLEDDQGNKTTAIGVDPIYAFLGKDYREFIENLQATKITNNIKPYSHGAREVYYNYFKNSSIGKLIAGDGTKLPFADKSADIGILSHIVDYVESQDMRKKIISELLRVLRDTGELRIAEVAFRTIDENTISLTVPLLSEGGGETNENITVASSEDWFEILTDVTNQGYSIYTVSTPYAPRTTKTILGDSGKRKGLIGYYSDQIGKTVNGCSGLIIRKDDQEPATEVYTNVDTEGEYRLLRLDISRSTPDHIHTEHCKTEVVQVSDPFGDEIY